MVNETKRTPKTDFLVNTFALESEKESKYVKRTLFCGSSRSLDVSLNPSGPKNAYKYFFLDYFSFKHFLATCCCF